jgi:RNA polymerase sigma-B factor
MCHAVLVQRLVARPTDDGADLSLADVVADQDGGYDDRFEVVDMLDLVIGELDPRDRRILSCRSDIAQEIGVSQRQISPLLTRILRRLRDRSRAG